MKAPIPTLPQRIQNELEPAIPLIGGAVALVLTLLISLSFLGGCASQGPASAKAVDIKAEPAQGFFLPLKALLPKGA
jgi:hypothetical protein